MRNQALRTPTLIIGAGIIGAHLVKRVLHDPQWNAVRGEVTHVHRPPIGM